MPHALNQTFKLKQDPETKKSLAKLAENFASEIQPQLDAALRESKIVHFARILVIDDQYIQVLTEYDGDKGAYTRFFRDKLSFLLKPVFAMVDGAPGFGQLSDDKFHHFVKLHDVKALGASTDPNAPDEGYLFSAYGTRTVQEMLPRLG